MRTDGRPRLQGSFPRPRDDPAHEVRYRSLSRRWHVPAPAQRMGSDLGPHAQGWPLLRLVPRQTARTAISPSSRRSPASTSPIWCPTSAWCSWSFSGMRAPEFDSTAMRITRSESDAASSESIAAHGQPVRYRGHLVSRSAHRGLGVAGYRLESLLWVRPALRRSTAPSSAASPTTLQGALPTALLAVAIAFLLWSWSALVIGISMTRTITRAVHRLYEGTRQVMHGDFSHRIEVQRQRSARRTGPVVQPDDRAHPEPAGGREREGAPAIGTRDRARGAEPALSRRRCRRCGRCG